MNGFFVNDSKHDVNATVVGSLAKVIKLQENAVATGNGTPYTPESPMTLTFVITGTSTSRTIVFEIADPISGVFQNLALATKLGDISYTPQLQTIGGTTILPESWEVDIPANYSFRARISAVAGGDVDISGWAVAQ